MQRTDWPDRKFNFDFPIGVFPYIVERLRGTPARLEDMLRSYPPEIVTRRVNQEWSIQEHAGHLLDLDELHEGRLDDYDAKLAVLRRADMENKMTNEAIYNAQPIVELLAGFRAARQHFVARLEAMDEALVARTAMHPRLKQPMRVVDFAYFVAEHDDLHLALISDLARNSKAK
jgi:hypothetical protein